MSAPDLRLLLPECREAGCKPRTNGRHVWTDHAEACPRYKGIKR